MGSHGAGYGYMHGRPSVTLRLCEDVALIGASFFESSGTLWNRQGRLVAMNGQHLIEKQRVP